MSEQRRTRLVAYLTCLATLAFVLAVGIAGGEHG